MWWGVAAVLLRMSSNRESASDFMGNYADTIYEKWIFDIPKIFDICTLYGSYNPKVASLLPPVYLFNIYLIYSRFRGCEQEVNRLVSSLFTLQPKLLDDLRQAVPIISQVIQVSLRAHIISF
jgi:hypothetical protein